MIWDFIQRRALEEAGARARREHAAWLTWALASNEAVPRIPVRRVDLGGFSQQVKREPGPAHAERWWALALGAVPDQNAE